MKSEAVLSDPGASSEGATAREVVDVALLVKAVAALQGASIKELQGKSESITSRSYSYGQYRHESVRQVLRSIEQAREYLLAAIKNAEGA